MNTASQIMNTSVVSIRPEETLENAVKLLTENKISGLPVVNSDNRVIGILTDRDLLKYSERLKIVPYIDYTAWIYPEVYFPGNLAYEKNANFFANTAVEEVMSKRVVTIKEKAPWNEVVSLMKKNSINRIPVTDEKGILKGIITRTDLLNHISDEED